MFPSLDPHTAELIGDLAAVLSTASFLPQVVKTWRSKSAGDLSIGMLCTFSLGVLCWLIYGISLRSIPMTVANGFTLLMSLILIGLRIRYGS